MKSTITTKTELESLVNEFEQIVNIQRALAAEFTVMNETDVANKINILTRGYSHCIREIKNILNN